MCTAISQKHLCGRTFDLEYSYSEEILVTPRSFPLRFRHLPPAESHPAIIGIGIVRENTPLYYDAVNESGLWAAGLNFPESAVYLENKAEHRNVASFEVIPWLLSHCHTLSEALSLLKKTNITSDGFHKTLPPTPLHFMIADKTGAVTVEPLASGLKIYDNPFGVLANEPEFSFHCKNAASHMALSPSAPRNSLCPHVLLSHYSRGMGALGLPGDYSSPSRFVRGVFAKTHTRQSDHDPRGISRFFRIMDSVSVPMGCVLTKEEKAVATLYTSCADTEKGVYYFTSYENRRIRAVALTEENKNGSQLARHPINASEDVCFWA